jgi:lysophospholipase L1-like esterase
LFWLAGAFLVCVGSAGAQARPLAEPEGRDWRAEMARVHARFQGRRGTFAQFGDSITESLAFWTPLERAHKNASSRMEHAFEIVNARLRPECWRDWKGPEFGNEGGQTVGWAQENVEAWLERLQPEVAVVMFGTNDLRDLEVSAYRDRLRTVVRRCLDRGTIVILSTIPPRHGFSKKAEEFAEAARRVARELAVPLVDYHAEILKRRPLDWDGAADEFQNFVDYEVPTLLARDGVHPSAPHRYQDDYSEKALACHGFGLRNYVVLLKYAEVIEAVTSPRPTVNQPRPGR